MKGDPGVGSIQRWLPGLLGHPQTNGRDADRPPDVENGEGVLKAFSDLSDDIVRRDTHVGEGHVGVFNAPASFKLASLPNDHAGCIHLQDECGLHFFFRPFSLRHGSPDGSTLNVFLFGGNAGNEGHHAGNGPVRAPEFFAIDEKV